MSDKLTEALNVFKETHQDMDLFEEDFTVLAAARRWASFPTDNDVEAFRVAMGWLRNAYNRDKIRAALEAAKHAT